MKLHNYLKYSRRLFIVLIILIFSLSFCSRAKNPDVTTDELLSHIKYLSSDSLKGRLTGSAGDSLAADYIRNEFADFGLVPLAGDGFQRFKVTKRVIMGESCSLVINGQSYVPDKDFMPLAFSSDGGVNAEVIFTGYGYKINTDSLKWNDYDGVDVKGKWVMVLRGDPENDNTNSPYIPYSGDRDKAIQAKDMGAAGVIMVSGPSFDSRDKFESLSSEGFPVGIPVIRIKKEVADIILSRSKATIADLEKKLNDTKKPSSFATKISVAGNSELVIETTNSRNVVMILPGEDDQLKNEYIIIGAHFDHLGMGGPGSSSRVPDTIGIHHGADDNASGVAMMLELAEKFAATKGSHKRSIIFIAFTGEEEGLLGSKHFTDEPFIDLTRVNAMINLDMLGRLDSTNNLQISGLGTATGLRDIIYNFSDTTAIKLNLSDDGYGPSDHSSFYIKNIPVLFYFTGAHLDYHTPSDTYDKINYKGMVRISGLIFNVAVELASTPSRLQFKESGSRGERVRYRRGRGVALRIMPDYTGVVKNGCRADAVTPGGPAYLGGMKKGDIITAISGKPVNDVYEYMLRMEQHKHGETISVEVLRNDKKEVLLIQL